MIAKTNIEIITGFLGSGKTSLINRLIEQTRSTDQRIIIIQCENGVSKIDRNFQLNKHIMIKNLDVSDSINPRFLRQIIDSNKPDRIIIEHNGTTKLNELLRVINKKELKRKCRLTSIIYVADAVSCKMYIESMGNILFNSIYNSNLIILTGINKISKDKLKNTVDLLKNINTEAKIIQADSIKEVSLIKEKEDTFSKILMVISLIFVFILVIHNINLNFDTSNIQKYIQKFSAIFTSIILEVFPFVMIGAFISAIIQEFLSEDFISNNIPKNKFSGILLASIMGMMFPICECAVIPIVRKLIKKGVPTDMAVTFMLAAPIVNPVSLISTYYAFYNKPKVAIVRGVFGILCAMIIGYIVGFIQKDNKVINNNNYYMDKQCNCGILDDFGNDSNSSRLIRVISHASIEVYSIGKYLIIGALLSSIFQIFKFKNIMSIVGQNYVISILVMMIFAYVLSICSAADAFIAKTFLGQFTIGSITAFLILGPMIDIKNTLMLFGNFKKKFVIELIICIIILSFIVGCLTNLMSMLGMI